jgi:hypothetical protein
VIRFGQAETADGGARGQGRQPALLLGFAAESVDRVHHQPALHTQETAQPAVAPLQLPVDQAVDPVVQAGTAIARQGSAEEVHFPQLACQFQRETLLDETIPHDRHETLVHPAANLVAHGQLFFVQQGIEVVEIQGLIGHEQVPS